MQKLQIREFIFPLEHLNSHGAHNSMGKCAGKVGMCHCDWRHVETTSLRKKSPSFAGHVEMLIPWLMASASTITLHAGHAILVQLQFVSAALHPSFPLYLSPSPCLSLILSPPPPSPCPCSSSFFSCLASSLPISQPQQYHFFRPLFFFL